MRPVVQYLDSVPFDSDYKLKFLSIKLPSLNRDLKQLLDMFEMVGMKHSNSARTYKSWCVAIYFSKTKMLIKPPGICFAFLKANFWDVHVSWLSNVQLELKLTILAGA